MLRLDLVCVGEFYSDFIFHGLKRVPKLGEEVKTDCFLRSPGGGAAITALTARRLGLNVGLVTVVGKETGASDLAPLAAAQVDTARSFTHPTRPTGVTVAVSTAKDRFLLTYPGANCDLEDVLPAGIFSYCAQARHMHLALLPRDFSRWISLARRLGACGVTTSWDHGWNPGLPRRRGALALLKALAIFLRTRWRPGTGPESENRKRSSRRWAGGCASLF